jgi:hypothetical protein
MKIQISLREIFDTPANHHSRDGIPAIPGMDQGITISRRLAVPWDFRNGSLMTNLHEQPGDSV